MTAKRKIVVNKNETAEKYELGMEDGFDVWGNLLANNYPVSKYKQPEGTEFKGIPYIIVDGKKQYITRDDYILTSKSGKKSVCSIEHIYKICDIE